MREVIYEISSKGLGMTCVIEGEGLCERLVGVITDGDLRRQMTVRPDIVSLSARDVMTMMPVTVRGTTPIAEALSIMESRKITSLIIADEEHVRGVLHIHDVSRTA